MIPSERGPHPVDVHVGARLRFRRKSLGLSQADLAIALGLTFQQVQKYERGSNRISASKLFESSVYLKVPVGYFFDGYVATDASDVFSESDSEKFVHSFLVTSEGIELAKAFPRVATAKIRRRLLDLVNALGEAG